ncbi:MAG: electron transfer flavoprotein alpha subunit [Cellvibrionaceae bacterium]|jgi:electron transfer flavoprotein alpha subunit
MSVFVYIENQNGEMASISSEALGAARKVAADLGSSVTAVVIGSGVDAVSAAAFDLGADSVVAIDDASLEHYTADGYGPNVTQMVQDGGASVFVAGASTEGRDITAWLSADTGAGVMADAIALKVDGGRVIATRTVYAGKLLADVSVPEGLQIVSTRNRALPPAESTGGSGSATMAAAVDSAGDSSVIGYSEKVSGVSLTDASIIVSGGRGVGGPEGFAPVQSLADTLGAAMGSSRAAVDAGWIDYSHQVGQTGKTVSPDLYVACGISGAIQHQAGMRTSKVIVAINKDSDAPIFGLASYGIVGDLFTVLPALEAEFKSRLS